MRNFQTGWALGLGFVLGGLLVAAPAQPASAANKRSRLAAATLTEGNAFYNVHVQDAAGVSRGQYTATTGASHPAGNGLNVLFGNGSPGTTFNTIRSYTTNTDYVQTGSGLTSSNTIMSLGPFGIVAAIGTTGVRTTYTLPGPGQTPDTLTIVQDVNVNGTTFLGSTVEVTTMVTNNGTGPVQIGIRYEWDFEIANDDGPTFQAINPNGAVLTNETQFLPPGFESYRIEDNNPPDAPTFDVFGTVSGPAFVSPTPTTPDLLQYVSWPDAVDTAFDYTVTPSLDVATESGPVDDSAVLYFFGHNSSSAITIPASASRTVSASLFLRQAAPQAARGVPALNGSTLLVLVMLLGGTGVWVLSRSRAIG